MGRLGKAGQVLDVPVFHLHHGGVFALHVDPGIDRPLTLPRHFTKNVTRLLKVTQNDGVVVTGRITSNTDLDVTLAVAEKKETKEVTLALADIKRAVVEIEFNRKDEN